MPFPSNLQLTQGTRYRVSSAIALPPGSTLTIPAGVSLYFDPDTAIGVVPGGVGGRLVIEGTAQRPVLLTSSSANPTPGNWKGVLLLGPADNVVRNARIEFAETGVRAINTPVEIADSRITQSGRDAISIEGEFDALITGNTLINENLRTEAGIKISTIDDIPTTAEVRNNTIQGFQAGVSVDTVASSSVEMTANRVLSNGVGISVGSVGFGRVSGAPQILDNMIQGNDQGFIIFGGAPRIERNMIVDNPCLAIYVNALPDDLGFAPVVTGNTILRNRGGCVGVRDLTIVHGASFGSLDARQNHWGSTNISEISDFVRDGVDIAGRAVARLCPVANASGGRVNCTDPRPR
jgi:hypothetical protein